LRLDLTRCFRVLLCFCCIPKLWFLLLLLYLTGMARRTINLKYVEGDKVALRKRAVLSVEKDAHLIYYNFAPAPTDEGIATEKMDPPLPTKKAGFL
jgi:hypothetical protein